MMNETTKRLWWVAIRWGILVVVAVALVLTVRHGWLEFQRLNVKWAQLKWFWLIPAIVLTWIGTAPGWLFWHQLLREFGLPISYAQSFRAFYLSQLGKYVPGKVMVVAIRTALAATATSPTNPNPSHTGESRLTTQAAEVNESRVPNWLIVSAAAVAETLMFVSVGSGWGVLGGAYFLSDSPMVLGLGLLIAVSILGCMLPNVLRVWLVRLPILKSRADREWLVSHWNWRLFFTGATSFSIGWLFLAVGLLSLTHVVPEHGGDWSDLPRSLTGVTLSTVLGFFSFIPGGLGVREVVLFPVLQDRFPAVLLIIILHRLVTLASESLAALASILLKKS